MFEYLKRIILAFYIPLLLTSLILNGLKILSTLKALSILDLHEPIEILSLGFSLIIDTNNSETTDPYLLLII